MDKGNETIHDNIGQNIFTKIADDKLDFIEKIDGLDNWRCIQSTGIDLVLNGVELASGGEKEYRVDRFIQSIEILNVSNKINKYHYYIKALKQGAPPLFSIGIGWERVLYMLLETKTIQEVMIYPKSQYGQCLLTSPHKEIAIYEDKRVIK